MLIAAFALVHMGGNVQARAIDPSAADSSPTEDSTPAPEAAPPAAAAATPAESAASTAAANASAAAAAATAAANAPKDPMSALIDSARFWDQKGKFDIAARAWDRVLELNPTNIEALGRSAYLAYSRDERDKAQVYLDKLRAIDPNNAELAAIDGEARRTPEQRDLITEARKANLADKPADAVKAFKAAFKDGTVPHDLAFEYYMALSKTGDDGLTQANDEFAKLAASAPKDARLQLSYGQYLRLREDTRPDAINLFAKLSKIPELSKSARQLWRETLLWEGADPQTRDQIDAYLADNPSDPEVEAKRADVVASLPDPALLDRMKAYEDVAAGRKEAAEKGFRSALGHDPNDAEAMIALSIIMRETGRATEADQMIAKAMKIAPDRRQEFINDIGFDPDKLGASKVGSGPQSVLSTEQYSALTRLIDAKQYDDAEAYLRKNVGNRWDTQLYNQLGSIQLANQHTPQAEESFRAALKLSPNDPNAMMLLGNALSQEGRPNDAAPLYDKAAEIYRANKDSKNLAALQRSRAEAQRNVAMKAATPQARIDGLRAALAIDPSDSWLRLEIARQLIAAHRTPEAKALMAEATNAAQPSAEDLHAGIVFAQLTDNLPEQRALFHKMVAGDMTDDIRQLRPRMQVLDEIDAANALGNRGATRQHLLSLAAQPDPTGVRGSEIGKALLHAGDKQGAGAAVISAYRATPSASPQQRLYYASVLLQSGQYSDANAMLAGLKTSDFPAESQTWFKQTGDAIAIQQANAQLKTSPGTAGGILTQRLAADPSNIDLNVALIRDYLAANDLTRADALATALLERNPNDKEALLAKISVASAQHAYGTVDDLCTRGETLFPDEIRFYMSSASAAQADGRLGKAMADLKIAKRLRAQQLRSETVSE